MLHLLSNSWVSLFRATWFLGSCSCMSQELHTIQVMGTGNSLLLWLLRTNFQLKGILCKRRKQGALLLHRVVKCW